MKNTLCKIAALATMMLLLFSLALPASAASLDQSIQFVPTSITVNGDMVLINGYFINHSARRVHSFTDFYMAIYQHNEMVFDAHFGSLQYFSLAPGGRINYTFRVTGLSGLNNGYYDCAQCGIDADITFSYRY